MATNVTAPIKGDDLVLTVGGKTTYHATSHQVNLDAEFEEYQTKDTNGKMNALVGHSGTAQADGLVAVLGSSSTSSMDTPAIVDAFLAGDEVELILKIENVSYKTTAWLTNVTLTGQVAQNATYSVSFKFSALSKVTA